MRVDRVVAGALETNCWIVAFDAASPAVVIDPADEPSRILEAVGGRDVSAVVLTHSHFDHLQAVAAVCEATGAPLLIHSDDAGYIGDTGGTGGDLFGFTHEPLRADRVLRDGDVVEAGDLRLQVILTPGHTEGSICLYAPSDGGEPPHLFAGDTVFAGSVGRTDFPRGDAHALGRSITGRIAPLPDDTVVHPGHGPDTTIGRERRVNPFFPGGVR